LVDSFIIEPGLLFWSISKSKKFQNQKSFSMALLFKIPFLLFYGPSKNFFENQIHPTFQNSFQTGPFFQEIDGSSLIG
jgi:hypothetical protein